MDLYYWKSPKGNFGDDLNEWLWDRLLPGWRDWDQGTTLVGVGTILNVNHFPPERPGRFLVVGSGVGNGPPPDISDGLRWDIQCLRGPRSARALGLDASMGVLDPAIMIADMPEFQQQSKNGPVIFIPHISSVDLFDWPRICGQAGIEFVSPCDDSVQVITRIASASVVLAESMHAAIIADAVRTPWIAVRVSSTFNAAKWQDWADSLEIDLTIRSLMPLTSLLSDPIGRKRRAVELGRTKSPGAASDPAAGRRLSWKRKLRILLERKLAISAMRRMTKRPRQLSDPAVLERHLARYRGILNTIMRTYAS